MGLVTKDLLKSLMDICIPITARQYCSAKDSNQLKYEQAKL